MKAEGWSPATDAAADSGGPAANGRSAGVGATNGPGRFHDEVLRTTADLDMMLAMAGVTGAAVGMSLADHLPVAPDPVDGVQSRLPPEAGLRIMDPAPNERDIG